MSSPTDQAATYSDLFSVPDHLIGEIIRGELIARPGLKPKHAHAAAALSAKLFNGFDGMPSDNKSSLVEFE